MSRTVFAVAAAVALSMDAGAQGTIVVAHGGDSLWNARVIEAARSASTGGPVEVSFLMGPAAKRTRFQDVVAKHEAAGVTHQGPGSGREGSTLQRRTAVDGVGQGVPDQVRARRRMRLSNIVPPMRETHHPIAWDKPPSAVAEAINRWTY